MQTIAPVRVPQAFQNPIPVIPQQISFQPFQQRVVIDRAQPLGKWSHLRPNNTIYVNNINEKLKREELIQSLRHVFGQFGKIMDIICYTKIVKAKGQAFIVFQKVESATKALEEMQNFMFYQKRIRVSYAKTKSDIIAKKDGSFVARKKRPRREKKKVEGQPATKKQNTESGKVAALPTNILVVHQLPQDASQTMVQMLFRKYPGYQSVTEPQKGSCHVIFDSEFNASRAKNGMQGFKFFNNVRLEISYGARPSIGKLQPMLFGGQQQPPVKQER